ncbi:hypothetical protein FRC14_001935 [Serendipita sp. 396]|nr:hypothetical protein FRC14_001935 [Serendipita sp. 396]KAG8772672.1 hypothetical protein FRC15_002581 [Serendipita sp. 397]
MVWSNAQPGPSAMTSKYSHNQHTSVSTPNQHPFLLPVLNVPHDPNYRTPAPIRLTDDLISHFGLFDAFQRQVIGHNSKQQQLQASTSQPAAGSTGASSGNNGVGMGTSTATTAGTGAGANAEDAIGLAKKEKKREKDLYKTLFHNLPGKHDTKRDRYLTELLLQPPKEGRIMQLDPTMAEMAFTIFDVPQSLSEEEENKKRKKKRKREQEQAQAQSQAPGATTFSTSVAQTPAHLPTPGGPLPVAVKQQQQQGTLKREADPSLSQRPLKRPRQDNYSIPIQQPTPKA